MMLKLRFAVIVAVACGIGLGLETAHCQKGPGDLLVTPTRLVFEGRTRTAELQLINTGEKTATYRIALVQRRMSEDGCIEIAEKAEQGELFASGLLRFSPSQIVLKPQEAQTVRVQLRLPADLPAGEYRSHLQFNGVPDQIGPALDDTEASSGGIGVMLRPIYGVAIAVIIRHGELQADLKLRELKFTAATSEQPAFASFSMNRSGSSSTYGDLIASLRTADGKSQLVGRMKGVAVYCPNSVRRVTMPLAIPPGTVTAGGTLLIGYLKQDERNAAPWDQQSINLEQ